MTGTPHLGLPLLAAAQAQKHVTHNEALALIDALAQIAVAARGVNDPPPAPEPGARVLVGSAPAGAFAGQAGKIALFDAGAWRFVIPQPGWLVWIEAESALVVFDGTDWIAAGSGGPVERVERLGIATDADAANRLALKGDAALFAARDDGDGDFRLAMNKQAAGDTVSQIFQSGFSGRAEMGLAGDDDFRFKVSPDGAAWFEAIRIDRASGRVTVPKGLVAPGAVLQSVYAEYRTNEDLSTPLPGSSDVIPASTQGTQVLSAAITPRLATSRIRIRFAAFGSCNAGPNQLVAALFRNAGTNALRAVSTRVTAAHDPVAIAIEHEDLPASAAEQTYRIRVGGSHSVARLNGNASGRFFGGTAAATLVLEEIAV